MDYNKTKKKKKTKYNISLSTAPSMPKLGKGTEYIKLLLSQVSKDMHEPMVPMLFPVLAAHISEAKNFNIPIEMRPENASSYSSSSFCPYRAHSFPDIYPGRCPGLGASGLSARVNRTGRINFKRTGEKTF